MTETNDFEATRGETTPNAPNVLTFPASRAAGRLLRAERAALSAFAIAQDAEIEFVNVGDEGNDEPGVASDRACLDFGDRFMFADRLIWHVMRPAGETEIIVLCGEMTAGRFPTLAEALDMLGRESWRYRAMRQRNAQRGALSAVKLAESDEPPPPNSAA
jgi:hypothetical protein